MGIIKISEKNHITCYNVTKCLSCHNLHLSVSLIIKAISSADKVSLLLSGHFIKKVESITGLGKSTVGRICQELKLDEENYKGRPSKLSPTNQRRIVNQIITDKLDNAVQAINYINTIIQKPVCPQTVRIALKRKHLKAVVKAKNPLLKARHRQRRLEFALYHQNWTIEDWKRVIWSDETKINRIGSDGKQYVWKKKGNIRQDNTLYSEVWRRKYDGMGLYEVEWSRNAYRS